MVEMKVSKSAVRVGRLGTAAAWISAVACLPYLFLKAVWTLDVPVGLTDRSVLDASGWVAGNAVMAVVQLLAVVLVLALVRPWSTRVPTWILLFPVWVGTGLLFQIVVGSALTVLSPSASADASTDLGGIAPWVYVLVYASFAVQGIALSIAFACHVRSRWGLLLGRRTADVIAVPSGQSWLRVHLSEITELVVAVAVVVALLCAYWAVGGSYGLSESRAPDTFGMQAARTVGAVVAAAGVLGLTGRWGRDRPLWLHAALTWVGSGALVAFDAFLLVLNRLFYLFDTSGPEADWAPIDTVLVIKILIGLVAALVGVLAVRPLTRPDDRSGRAAAHKYATPHSPDGLRRITLMLSWSRTTTHR